MRKFPAEIHLILVQIISGKCIAGTRRNILTIAGMKSTHGREESAVGLALLLQVVRQERQTGSVAHINREARRKIDAVLINAVKERILSIDHRYDAITLRPVFSSVICKIKAALNILVRAAGNRNAVLRRFGRFLGHEINDAARLRITKKGGRRSLNNFNGFQPKGFNRSLEEAFGELTMTINEGRHTEAAHFHPVGVIVRAVLTEKSRRIAHRVIQLADIPFFKRLTADDRYGLRRFLRRDINLQRLSRHADAVNRLIVICGSCGLRQRERPQAGKHQRQCNG